MAGQSSSRRSAGDLGSRPNERGRLVSRACTICSHPARETINSSLVRRVPYRRLAERYSVSQAALSRHLNEHLADYVQQALSEYGTSKGIKVLAKLGGIIDRLDMFLDKTEEGEDILGFRATAAEMRKQLELVAKLQGELAQEGATTNYFFISPDVARAIAEALAPFPAAGHAVSDVLKELEGGVDV